MYSVYLIFYYACVWVCVWVCLSCRVCLQASQMPLGASSWVSWLPLAGLTRRRLSTGFKSILFGLACRPSCVVCVRVQACVWKILRQGVWGSERAYGRRRISSHSYTRTPITLLLSFAKMPIYGVDIWNGVWYISIYGGLNE